MKKSKKETLIDEGIKNPLLDLPERGSHLIIAVSGGPDSVYLLMRLLPMREEYTLTIAHVNHGIRGKKSDRDEKFVETLAEKLNLPFRAEHIKKTAKGNLEEFLRNERYALLESIRAKHKADWIVTAHHLNDNIETILFNTIRGSFLEGMSGMDTKDAKRHIWRPLLATSKDEIVSYLKKNRIPFCIDETNEDTRFSRNALRKQVVPVLKRINPGLEKTAVRNANIMKELTNYLEQQTGEWIQKNAPDGNIDQESFLKAHTIMQKNIIATFYRACYGNSNGFNQAHLDQILDVITVKKANRRKEFGPRYSIGIKTRNGKRIISIMNDKGKSASILLKKRVKEVE